MTDAELRQLIESNARTAQANSEGIQELKTSITELRVSTENLRVLIERNHDIMIGQQKAMVRAFDGLNNVVSEQLDLSVKIAELESRLQRLESRENGMSS